MLRSVLIMAALYGAPSGDGEPPDPQALAEKVVALAEEGELDAALELIEDANRRSPDPVYMFMRASLEEQLGRCDSAVALYREFLRGTDVSERDQDEARAGLRRCGVEPPDEAPEPEPAPPPPVVVTPPPPPTEDRVQPQPRVDPWGVALTSVGVVVAATGAGLWAQALVDTRDARTTDARSRYVDLTQRASTFERTGVTLVSVGAAVAVAGVVRLVVVGVRRSRTRPTNLRARRE